MPRITLDEVKALAERTKLNVTALDTSLLTHVENEVLGRLAAQVDAVIMATWIDASTTPDLIRTIITKKYFSWFYMRQYSEDVGTTENTYADKLDRNAEMLIKGILDGSIVIIGLVDNISTISFYPTDQSSALDRRDFPDDPSVGPASFTMGTVF